MKEPRILVGGIGNIFLGDDSFGVEVIQRLFKRPQPPGVRLVDFGIKGFDLTYALLEDYDAVILIDAVPRGEAPGTIYIIEPEIPVLEGPAAPDLMIATHGMDPVKVLRLAAEMGASLNNVLLVGCEPMPDQSEEDMAAGLSKPVLAAVDEAVSVVESLIGKILSEQVSMGT